MNMFTKVKKINRDPIPTPALPLKGREVLDPALAPRPLKGREVLDPALAPRPLKGREVSNGNMDKWVAGAGPL